MFLARYTSNDVRAEDNLAPRLEAMKAFLARYPSRRTATEASPGAPSESVAAPAAASEPVVRQPNRLVYLRDPVRLPHSHSSPLASSLLESARSR